MWKCSLTDRFYYPNWLDGVYTHILPSLVGVFNFTKFPQHSILFWFLWSAIKALPLRMIQLIRARILTVYDYDVTDSLPDTTDHCPLMQFTTDLKLSSYFDMESWAWLWYSILRVVNPLAFPVHIYLLFFLLSTV